LEDIFCFTERKGGILAENKRSFFLFQIIFGKNDIFLLFPAKQCLFCVEKAVLAHVFVTKTEDK